MEPKSMEQNLGSASDACESSHGSAQSRNRERRIDEILSASTAALAADGYAGFATRRVATSAGITLSNLQYYFPTKEALLRATIETFLENYVGEFRGIAGRQDATPNRRLLDLLGRIYATAPLPQTNLVLREVWAMAQHDALIADLVDAAYGQFRTAISDLFLEVNPTLSSEDCRIRATAMIAQAEGLLFLEYRNIDGEKGYSDFIRIAKRSGRLLAEPLDSIAELPVAPGLAGQSILADSMDDDSWRDYLRVRASTFDSNNTALHDRFDLTLPNSNRDVPDYRTTPQSRRRAEKLNQIITVAAQVFAAEGYARFTQARVAEAAGILPAGLKYYFKTHEDLLRATIHALMTAYIDRYSSMSRPNGKPAIERLLQISVEILVEGCDPLACKFAFEMFALARRAPFVNELLVKVYDAYREIFVSLIREIDPSASDRECHARATMLAVLMDGLIVYTYRTGGQTADLPKTIALFRALSVRIAMANRRAPQPPVSSG